METERFDTVVIGAGQGGLLAAYYLQRAGRPFVVLEGHTRVGDNWRERYDSLRLFTPAYGVSLVGFPYKKKGQICPTKDEMADYLERYAEHFGFPIRLGVRVTGLTRGGDTCVVDHRRTGSRLRA
jgi:putative flavoprotein involved in K+ transport